jgi:hypothetical protein
MPWRAAVCRIRSAALSAGQAVAFHQHARGLVQRLAPLLGLARTLLVGPDRGQQLGKAPLGHLEDGQHLHQELRHRLGHVLELAGGSVGRSTRPGWSRWSTMYSLGCVLYALLTGAPPTCRCLVLAAGRRPTGFPAPSPPARPRWWRRRGRLGGDEAGSPRAWSAQSGSSCWWRWRCGRVAAARHSPTTYRNNGAGQPGPADRRRPAAGPVENSAEDLLSRPRRRCAAQEGKGEDVDKKCRTCNAKPTSRLTRARSAARPQARSARRSPSSARQFAQGDQAARRER